MEHIEKNTARLLLECRAVQLRPDNPFQWASGWKSPIYCDNRKTLSYPEIRNFIKDSFVTLIKEKYFSTEAIAGVATGAIAQGALVAFFMSDLNPKDMVLKTLLKVIPSRGNVWLSLKILYLPGAAA
jgi:orotate phosphoribosyltransferase